ncbi:arsenate reductase ArsC [Limnochorda pilosa]|uniref:Arsenate reductase n=1 Tax=Limnochorda pilosa TaxID=1555112 RepID=A0A0K2SFP1_LIMPI|nr:arsenate reductase ArsC [Limnochorda pilosa]BAS25921.1 arsenate reductase [Limnochorda pilosa]
MSFTLLFLCTGNSCRSQMAEGYARLLGERIFGSTLRVESAGLEPKGLHPRAIQVMAEEGIDISSQTSDLLQPGHIARTDMIVTLCGDAEERCPVTPPSVERRHWPLPDPARATGSEEQVLRTFRFVRDEIRTRVAALLQELQMRQDFLSSDPTPEESGVLGA